jgi:quercetin dioxygenase-like cupin family protein
LTQEYVMNVEEFEAAVRQQGYEEVVTRDYGPNHYAGDHSHPFDARALIVSGDITISAGGASRHYPTGTVFELAAGTVHQEQVGPGGVVYLVGRRTVHAPG